MTLKVSHPKLLRVAVPLEKLFAFGMRFRTWLWVKGGVHRGKQKAEEAERSQRHESLRAAPGISALLFSSLLLNKSLTE